MHPDYIQREVFFWNEGDPCPQAFQLNATHMEPCKYLTGYDYFEVSNVVCNSTTKSEHIIYDTHYKGHIRICEVPLKAPDRNLFQYPSRAL